MTSEKNGRKPANPASLANLAKGHGRPKGVPNKLTAQLKDMVLRATELAGEDADKPAAEKHGGGVAYLKWAAKEHPGAFLSLVGKAMPLQVTGQDGQPLIPPGGITFVIQQQPDAENRE